MEVVAEVHSNLSVPEFDWIVSGGMAGFCKNRILTKSLYFSLVPLALLSPNPASTDTLRGCFVVKYLYLTSQTRVN